MLTKRTLVKIVQDLKASPLQKTSHTLWMIVRCQGCIWNYQRVCSSQKVCTLSIYIRDTLGFKYVHFKWNHFCHFFLPQGKTTLQCCSIGTNIGPWKACTASAMWPSRNRWREVKKTSCWCAVKLIKIAAAPKKQADSRLGALISTELLNCLSDRCQAEDRQGHLCFLSLLHPKYIIVQINQNDKVLIKGAFLGYEAASRAHGLGAPGYWGGHIYIYIYVYSCWLSLYMAPK